MSDISVTASSVLKASSQTKTAHGVAGASLTAGQPIYKDATANDTMKPCVTSSQAAANCLGIALHAAASGQPIEYATEGDVTFNAVLTAGAPLFVSDNAGGLRPLADAGTGDWICLVGVPTSTTNLRLCITATGTQVA